MNNDYAFEVDNRSRGFVNARYDEPNTDTYRGCELRIKGITPEEDFRILFDTGDFDYDIYWINQIAWFLDCGMVYHMSSVDHFYMDRS